MFSADPEAEKRRRPEVGQLLGQCPVLEAGLDLGVQGLRVLTCHLGFRVQGRNEGEFSRGLGVRRVLAFKRLDFPVGPFFPLS